MKKYGEGEAVADDIVTRLRAKYAGQLPICNEAADEIERLRYELVQANNQIKLLIAIETAGRQEDIND